MPNASRARKARTVSAGASVIMRGDIAHPNLRARLAILKHPMRYASLRARIESNRLAGGTRRLLTPQTERAKQQLRGR